MAAAVIALIVNFPRGLFVLLLAVLALAAGWQGVLHRGMVRVIGIAIAVVALAAVLVLLLSRDVVDTIDHRRRRGRRDRGGACCVHEPCGPHCR